nr:immunoglobulin heavy chain junction region [Mus musculus]MBK4183795.1 immunoglobulin heavy chain junction region [Mus musculus]MBK4183796.1 immunoglobulin heavy chain junction region [Mus musculus]MBK4185187.1 immunoglobulin heavy chain junction region [Mus musculus]MBK4185188.1 immunoglobulin heavy chain junction region [Mus musculus]
CARFDSYWYFDVW